MVNRSEQSAREGTTARHQSEVAKALDDICAEIFPDRRIRFSLFTVRHQFIANMKAVWRDEAVGSALIGQLIVKTGRAHYTKVRRRLAEEIREVPVPPKRSVDRFQMLLAMYRERAELREAKAVRRALDDDDRRLQIDQVVVGVGKEGMPFVSAGPSVRPDPTWRVNFGTVSLAAPQAASSRVSRYSRTDRRVLAMASPVNVIRPGRRALLVGIGSNQAGIDRKGSPRRPALRPCSAGPRSRTAFAAGRSHGSGHACS